MFAITGVVSIAIILFISLIYIYIKKIFPHPSGNYFKRSLSADLEQEVYLRLVEVMAGDKIVLYQAAFSVLSSKANNKKESFFKSGTEGKIEGDFVICNEDFSVFAIVELDNKKINEDKDKLINGFISEAGIKTYRIKTAAIPSVNELRKAIK